MAARSKKNTDSWINNPHDKALKLLLSEQSNAKSFFREYLPAQVTEGMDFDTLKIRKETFIDKELAVSSSDLLYEIKLNGSPAFIYLLIEHKSWADRLIAFQLLKYEVKIWELFLKQHKKADKLPLILPLAIYHGQKQWDIDKNFAALFADDLPQHLKVFLPDFQYHLNDISHIPDHEIKGDILIRVFFMAFKYILAPELIHKLPGILELCRQLLDKTRGTEYLDTTALGI